MQNHQLSFLFATDNEHHSHVFYVVSLETLPLITTETVLETKVISVSEVMNMGDLLPSHREAAWYLAGG